MLKLITPKINIQAGASLSLKSDGLNGELVSGVFAGGGGAGGAVLLQASEIHNEGSFSISVRGGNSASGSGSCSIPGGGSAGRLHVDVFSDYNGALIQTATGSGNGVSQPGTCYFGFINAIDCALSP